jgi:CubicO group peptidase (beta-lactamase class C family)
MNNQKLIELLEENTGKLFSKAVCAVSINGETCFNHSVNCNEDAVFDLASVSKILTATILFKLCFTKQLIGQGRLSIDQSVESFFQDAPIRPLVKERLKNITIQSLLTHSSGLPAWFPFYTQTGGFWDVLEIALKMYPGQAGTVYSDLGFMLLGEIVCAASGLTLQQNLENLNAELDTAFTYNPKDHQRCVETEQGNRIETRMCAERNLCFNGFRDTEINMQGEVNDGNAFYFWKGAAGHAGVFGTAADLLCLAALYLNNGKVNGKRLIPSELIEKSFVHYGGRGLAWVLGDIFINGLGHTGFTGTSIYLCPEKNIAAALLTNRLVIEPAPDLRSFRMEAHRIIYE